MLTVMTLPSATEVSDSCLATKSQSSVCLRQLSACVRKMACGMRGAAPSICMIKMMHYLHMHAPFASSCSVMLPRSCYRLLFKSASNFITLRGYAKFIHMCLPQTKMPTNMISLPFCIAHGSCRGVEHSAISAEFIMSNVQVFLMQYRRFGVVPVPQERPVKNAAQHMVPICPVQHSSPILKGTVLTGRQ